MRGEYLTGATTATVTGELPPHARRIRRPAVVGRDLDGTTSACAENTTFSTSNRDMARNYLRMRGEYFTSLVWPVSKSELPPHARRILALGSFLRWPLGTTSACAENTDALRSFH